MTSEATSIRSGFTLLAFLRARRDRPEVDAAAVHLDHLLRFPLPHLELVRNDARAGLELGPEPRPQLLVEVGQQVEGDYRGFAEVGLEQVLLAELDQVGHAVAARVLVRLADAVWIDVDADRTHAEALGRGDRDAAGAWA